MDQLSRPSLASDQLLRGDLAMTQSEAQWEWVCRWVFAQTGQRPKLDRISNRDLALLFEAITAQVDRAKLSSDAQTKQR